MNNYRYVNKNVKRADGIEKVTGSAKFGADLYRKNMLFMKAVYTSCVHGKLLAVHTQQAAKETGVAGIYTAEDIPGKNGFGIIVQDQPAISEQKVYAWSDVIAVVAAENSDIADRAAKLVWAEYEPLPVVNELKTIENSDEIRGDWYPQNISSQYFAKKGSIEEGFGQSSVRVSAVYETQRIEHSYIEPEAILTEWENGCMVVRGSMQLPFDVQSAVAAALNLPKDRVSVRRSAVGGSFGGKIELTIAMAIRAALATMKTGRPVKYVLDREESFRESHKRHLYEIQCQIGADSEGHFTAMRGRAKLDGGIYMNLSPAVAWKGVVLGCGPYLVPHTEYKADSLVTNQVTCGSMRGFGTPQSIYAMENTINELAYRMGLSPYELRKRNLLHTGDISPVGHLLDSQIVSVEQVLDYVAEHLKFEEKYRAYLEKNKTGNARFRYGVGIACTMRGTSGAQMKDKSQAILYVDKRGILHISLGLVEMGQGLKTAMIQIVAEQFDIAPEKIIYDEPDTCRELDPGTTTGSRGTFMGGKALIEAAGQLKEQIKLWLKGQRFREQAVKEGQALFEKSKLISEDHQSMIENLSWEEIFSLAADSEQELKGIGVCELDLPAWDFEKGQGAPFHVYTYSAQAAEVCVDTWTGKVQVLEIAACHDAGRIINPPMARGQVEGGIVMSMGQALYEQYQIGKDGIPLTKDFTQYLIPTIQEMPKIQVGFIENEEEKGPFGAKSIAEPSAELGLASISGAVNMAIGMDRPIRSLPMTPEKILMHLKGKDV